jgi:putative transposase
MTACQNLSQEVGTAAACRSLDIARATFYRRLGSDSGVVTPQSRPAPPRALSEQERQAVLEVLHGDRFVDRPPTEVYASLLDEGRYLCSIRTMYRILAGAAEVRERRDQLRHPNYKAPELIATGPNQVWSWDITKLLGPVKWTYFYLYVILDIFSRYVVGWMVAARENAALARHLIAETCRKEGVQPGQISLHADRGGAMIAKPVALLLADLGVTKSHSRPHVSNDNPFSESQFKTLKYWPGFPERFGSIQDARSFCQEFFAWYNQEHRHSGIGLMTPAAVHHGKVDAIGRVRRAALSEAFLAHPERFVRGTPQPPAVPEAAWINKPKIDSNGQHTRILQPESEPLSTLVGDRPLDNSRSTATLEGDAPDRHFQPTGNDTKFESQVSQNH